ncbi:hypothetical protein SAMN05421781_2371 [Marinococcus luteus]|uniref:Uncharacterized protein n=1 Tax=Marinococcus luteus TaxID=1122204 RepID=A0A1H2WCR7_9BACI|nr:hypothetical protein [Marinococcus luteus]SDW78422.1 hypothetical protein SAMN05421781_2371 [Marinococcus luteus]
MLFHYHHWTPYIEQTEAFYARLGFRVSQRIGKYNGSYQSFDPPLDWDDFRGRPITFRIIEMRRGSVNITFGQGKRVMFDHIGYLTNERRLGIICQQAETAGLRVQRGEKRTFISTSHSFRVELQTHQEAVDEIDSPFRLQSLNIETTTDGLEQEINQLLHPYSSGVQSLITHRHALHSALISHPAFEETVDPNGVKLISARTSS